MSPFAIVTANGPIRIHSLQVGGEMTVVFAGTASRPSHVTIATTLDNQGNVELDNSTLTVPVLNNPGGLEAQGTSVVTSPALQNNGIVDAVDGSLTLTDSLAQLNNGTLTGGSWEAVGNAVLVLPGDVTSLASGTVGIDANSAIKDPSGRNALSGLTSVGSQATLFVVQGSLALAGSLTSDGTIDIGTYSGGGTLTVAGTLTQAHGILSMTAGSLTARTVVIDQGASLAAGGTLVGDLVNNGAVSPFTHLDVTGNYSQGANATLTAGFVSELQVTGEATLAGELISGRTPPAQPGTRGTAITFSSLSGGFTGHNLGFTIVTGANQIDVIAQPQIGASPSTAARGAAMTVTGADFGYATTVAVHLDGAGGPVLGTAQVSIIDGTFSVSVTIPASAPAGSHKLVAVGSDGRQAEVAITVS
jgi:hypothetical protein